MTTQNPTAKAPRPALEALAKAKAIVHAASEGKADDILVLDVRQVSPVTDYFVIFTGNSQVHLRALSRRVEDAMRELGAKPTSIDGARGSNWVAMDFGNVIVHAMTRDSRQLFDLERLWGDAPRVDLADAS